jgi:hypothetical protein
MNEELARLRIEADEAIEASIRDLEPESKESFSAHLSELQRLAGEIDSVGGGAEFQVLREDLVSAIVSLAIGVADYRLALELTEDLPSIFRARSVNGHLTLMLRIRALHSAGLHAQEPVALISLAECGFVDDEYCARIAWRILEWHQEAASEFLQIAPRIQHYIDTYTDRGAYERVDLIGEPRAIRAKLIQFGRWLRQQATE